MGEANFCFKDKVVLVTGSAGNIGKKIVEKFAETGAKVVIVDIDEDGVRNVSQICKNISPHKYDPLEIVADLSKQEDLERVIETTIKNFGKLDVLVNNAAVSMAQTIYDAKAVETFDYTIKVNLRAPYVLTHLSTPYLSETRGCIVNVSSVHSSRTCVNCGAYGITKSGLGIQKLDGCLQCPFP